MDQDCKYKGGRGRVMGKEGEVRASSAHLSREWVSCDEKQRRTDTLKEARHTPCVRKWDLRICTRGVMLGCGLNKVLDAG